MSAHLDNFSFSRFGSFYHTPDGWALVVRNSGGFILAWAPNACALFVGWRRRLVAII